MSTPADWLVSVIGAVPSWAVYLVACGIVYTETATLVIGLVMPSEAVLVAAGVAAAIGPTDVGWLAVAACVAAVAGDTTGYWLGRSSGHRVKESRLGRRIGAARWAQAEAQVRGGMIAVITGRWIGFVRTVVPPVAGITRMGFRRFWIADVIGATSWAIAVVLLGYFAGAALGATILMYAAVAAGAVGIGWLAVRWWRGRRAAAS